MATGRHPPRGDDLLRRRAAGVSIASVSRVLQGSTAVSERTRQRSSKRPTSSSTCPSGAARSLAVRHHEAHGLVLPELSGPYYSELLLGFESRAAELGQSVVLMLAEGKDDLARAVRKLATRVDGLAMLGSAPSRRTVPALHGRSPSSSSPATRSPTSTPSPPRTPAAPEEITSHVLGHGRTRVLFVGDPDVGPDVRDRYAGFVAAHEAPRPDRRRAGARPRCGRATAPPSPTASCPASSSADALVCANDELALAVMKRLREGGNVVPDDIAIVGWDDVMTARYVEPGLTTVRQPVRELGALAADRLHERITGATAGAGPQVIPTSWSSAPPAAARPATRRLRRPDRRPPASLTAPPPPYPAPPEKERNPMRRTSAMAVATLPPQRSP